MQVLTELLHDQCLSLEGFILRAGPRCPQIGRVPGQEGWSQMNKFEQVLGGGGLK